MKEQSLMDFWPILVGATVVLLAPLLLVFDPSKDFQSRETTSRSFEIASTNETDGTNDEPTFEVVDRQVEQFRSTESIPVPDPIDAAESEEPSSNTPSELGSRTADWRYVGTILSAARNVALIERLDYPGKRESVAEGERLEGVEVVAVTSDSLELKLEEDSRTLLLDQGPAFDTSDILIPEETLDDPEILAAVVFAQTLGKYSASEPDFSTVEEDAEIDDGSMFEMMESISASGDFLPPFEEESVEDWGKSVAEELASNPESPLDPSSYPLSEDSRHSLLGFDRLSKQN